MLPDIGQILSPAAALGLAVYGAATYFIAAPEIGTRIFEHDYRAACEGGVLDTAETRLSRGIEDLPGIPQEILDRERAIEAARGARHFGEGLDKMARLIGGATYDEMLDAQAAIVRADREEYEEQRQKLEAELHRQAEARIAAAPDFCSCSARAAIETSRQDWALFAGSFSAIVPPTVAAFPKEIERHASACTGTPA